MLRHDGRRWTLRLVLVAGIVAFTAIDTARAADICARPHEQRGLYARVLQTQLMVAALQCQSSAEYNAFVTKFREQLVERGNSLRSMFVRQHGGGANRYLNALVTRLANEASQRSMAGRMGFCREAQLIFAEAQRMDASGFDSLATKAAEEADPGIRPCGG